MAFTLSRLRGLGKSNFPGSRPRRNPENISTCENRIANCKHVAAASIATNRGIDSHARGCGQCSACVDGSCTPYPDLSRVLETSRRERLCRRSTGSSTSSYARAVGQMLDFQNCILSKTSRLSEPLTSTLLVSTRSYLGAKGLVRIFQSGCTASTSLGHKQSSIERNAGLSR